MISEKEITKPVVAWCIGTINEQISGEVQFGHAGAKSNKQEETAQYKNQYLKQSGATVPESFMDFGDKIEEVYLSIFCPHSNSLPKGERASSIHSEKCSPFLPLGERIQDRGITEEIQEKLSQIQKRKKTSFTSTISDERGEELLYNGKKISEFTQNPDIGRLIGHLWLKRELPDYACNFLHTVIVLIADHGPAVSGAQNTIITARAGNELKSSLIAGLSSV